MHIPFQTPKRARIGKCAHESGRSAPALERFAPVEAGGWSDSPRGMERFGSPAWGLTPPRPRGSPPPQTGITHESGIARTNREQPSGRERFHETASACHQTSHRTTAESGGCGHARRLRLIGDSPGEIRSRPRLSDFTRSRCSSRQHCHPQRRVIQCHAWKQRSPSGLRLISSGNSTT